MDEAALKPITDAPDTAAALDAAATMLARALSASAVPLLEGAATSWAALEQECRRAWQRYPAIRPTGAHGGEADPRAIQLFATLTYVTQAGLYTPAELRERLAESPDARAWVAGEAARIEVLIAVLGHLVRALDSGEIPAAGYGDAVVGVAKRIGAMAVGTRFPVAE